MSVYVEKLKNARINGAGQNNGGVLGGIGYLTEKLALGTVSGLEGIVDYTVGGLAKLFGADEFAEDIFDDDWLDYGHADEWYDPSEGWKFAGDVAGGIGTSIPSIVGAVAGGALIAASGGTAAPAGIKLIGASLAPLAAGLSGAGNATKDAYRETGVLTGKEFGYGALTGATEAGLEALTGGIGTGTARIAKNIVKSMAKETGETITKLGAKSVFKTLASDFASEAVEEGLAEFLSPQYQRMTYNPDAKNATAEEIGYAALVGGLSGLVMGGSAQVVSTGSNLISGNRAVENGNADSIMKTAQYFADFEAKGETGYESFKTIKEVSARLSESLLKTNGQVSTVSQKIMLGQLQRANVAATFMPFVERSASTVLADADGVVARFNELGMTDENGKRLSFTKEELLKGIRTDLLGKSSLTRSERIELNRSIRKSLESGGALSKLAVMDATGRITMSTKRFSKSIMLGRKIKSADELNRFVETAKPEEINALSSFLGIEDWRRETIDSINRKIDAARSDGRFEQLKNEFKAKKVTSSTGEGVGNGPSRTPVPTGDIGIVPNNAGIVPNNVGIVPNNVPNIVPQSAAPGGSFAALESDIVKTLANKNAVTRMNSENMQVTGERLAIKEDVNGEKFVDVTEDIFNINSGESIARTIQKTLHDRFNNLIDVGGQKIQVNKTTNDEFRRSEDATKLLKKDLQKYNDKLRTIANADEILAAAKNWIGEQIGHLRKDDIVEFARADITYRVGNNGYVADVVVGIRKNGAAVLYDLVNIYDKKIVEAPVTMASNNYSQRRQHASTAKIITQTSPNSNTFSQNNSGNVTGKRSAIADGQSRTPVPTGDNVNLRYDNGKGVSADKNNVSDNKKQIDLIKETNEIDAWAAEKVPEYMKLSEPNRRAVRATVRQARAAGISETSARTMARVAARSGLNVVFDFEGLRVKGDDGLYDGSNTIFLNPSADGQRLARSLLLHEAGHALIMGNSGTKAGSKIINRLISETKKKNDIRSESLRNKYRDSYKDKGFKQEQLDFVIEEEVLMHHLEDVLGSESAWEYILSEDASIGQRFLSFLRRSAQVYSDSDALSSESRRLLRDYKKLFDSFAERNYQRNAFVNEKSPAEGREQSAIQKESNDASKISSKMTDAERYEILKDRTISLGAKTNNERLAEVQKKLDITDENIEFSEYGDRKRLLRKIADEFGVFHKYKNADVMLDFGFSRGNFKHSISSQRKNYTKFVKMLSCFDEVINNAVGIEVHKYDNYKHDPTLDNVYVLTSAFVDGDTIVPVKLEIKQFSDKENTLYVAVALESIKIDEVDTQGNTEIGVTKQYAHSSIISIAEMFKKINPSDESFLKYIPDGFLDEIQLEAKRKALEADAKKGKTVETNEDAEKLLKERRALHEEDTEAFFEEDENAGTEENGQSRTPVPTGDSEKGKAAKRVPSRGEVAKRNADAQSDRVYNRKEIFESLKRVLPGDITVSVTDELWEGLNSQRNAAGRRAYIESMIPRVNKMLIVESRRFENADPAEIKEAEGRVAEALAGLLSKGTESKRVRLDAAEKVKAAEKDAESKVNAARKNAAEKIAKERDKRSKREEHWKTTAKNLQSETYLRGLLSDKAYQMKDLKIGRFRNATEAQVEIFRGSIEKLSKIQFRGNLSPKMIRRTVRELREGWYTKDNPVLQYVDKNDPGLYNEGIAEMMDALATGDSVLSVSELKTLHDVMSYFVNFVQNFGKVYRRGKWIEAEPEAKRYIGGLQSNAQLNVGLFRRLAGSTYSELFSDPMVVARRFDFYESDGFYTEMMEDFRDAAVDAQVAEMDIREAYDAFMEKHKRYVEKANAEEVEYRGAKLSKMHFIGLYMTMKRHHAVAGLVLNGFAFDNVKGDRVRVPGLLPEAERVTEAELRSYADEQIALMADKLSEADKEYVSILEKVYNEDARALKVERDMQRMGFTNASDDYYYPIKRGNTATSLDSDFKAELDRVSSASFNKDTVKGAKQELFIESADKVFNRHLRAVCQYAYLSPAIDAYDRLFHLDISGNPNKPVNISTESVKVWKKGNDYFKKLIADIQGISPASKEGQELLGRIRGSYAKYQLGANPKVWLTQLSSLCASSSILDFDSIARGMGLSSEGLDKYCSLAKLRNNDNTAALAQGVLDTRAKRAASGISRFSDLLMAPIGKMDRFVVGRLFGACQAQVEKDGGARIGTEENKIEAGKLLRRVLLETQQNSVATERSAAMRSGNEILKAVTMFSADSMKVTGRVIDALGELSTLKARLKGENDAGKRAELEKRIEAANRKALKASGAMVTSAIFMASVAQLFRFIYDKEDKDDKGVIETMTADAVGNLFGGLPVIRDIYTKFFDGYDVNNYAYDMFNDLIDSAKAVFDLGGNIISGESTPEERNLTFRNLFYSVGQLTGLPVRNVYNVFYGLTKRFSPETAYKIDNAFYKKNFQTELYKAIEEEDDRKTSFVMELLLGERISGEVDEAVFSELLSLSKEGQKVLPKTMPKTVTVDGEEYVLSDEEREILRDVYSGSEDSLKKLFTTSSYKALSSDDRAAAIGRVNELYYKKAMAAAGIESAERDLIFAEALGYERTALLYVKTKGLESDRDSSGKAISGSKKRKVLAVINSMGGSAGEKLLMLASRGYGISDGDIPGMKADFAKKLLISYIMKIPGKTSKEKAAIAEACGFTVVNGRIKMG